MLFGVSRAAPMESAELQSYNIIFSSKGISSSERSSEKSQEIFLKEIRKRFFKQYLIDCQILKLFQKQILHVPLRDCIEVCRVEVHDSISESIAVRIPV